MPACLLKLVHSVDVVFKHLAEESATVNLHSWKECELRVLSEQKSLGYLVPCLVRGCCAKNAFCMVFADNAAQIAKSIRSPSNINYDIAQDNWFVFICSQIPWMNA